jgi:hypothetical protein
MTFYLDDIGDLRQRAVAVLTLFPDNRLPMVIQLLEGMAGSLGGKDKV